MLAVAVAVLVVAAAAGVGGVLLVRSGPPGEAAPAQGRPLTTGTPAASTAAGTSDATATTTATTTSTATATATPSPSVATSAATDPAVQLEGRRAASLAATTLDGRWVAQLSSKFDGVSDPSQRTASGSSTFFLADILAEHEAIVADPRWPGQVLLLASTDFGRTRTPPPSTIWVTVVDHGFADSDAVTTWCASTFPGLTGADLQNRCLPRRLEPPS